MSKFKVTIEETVSQEFEVEATTLMEAMEIAKQKYKDGELVVDSGNLLFKQMQVQDVEEGSLSYWSEF